MKASKVDLVFVIDASRSMKPCFDALARHLDEIIRPLQGFNLQLRFGLVAVRIARSATQGIVVFTDTLAGGMDPIYSGSGQDLFTTNGEEFARKLSGIEIKGDENSLLALDFALDFPFGAVSDTRRVVAMFSDERVEDGALPPGMLDFIPKLVEKITARRILLFAAMPASRALEELATADGAQIETVDGGDGLANVNFSKLMAQMAKSISVASAQGMEGEWQRALFGQDRWDTDEGSFEGMH